MADPEENIEPKKKKEKLEPKSEPKTDDVLLRDKSNIACSFSAEAKVQ